MKKLFATLLVAMGLMTAMPSQAQIKWGVKAGLNLTEMHFSDFEGSVENKNGFFVGPMAKFTLPIVGLGIDGAILYDQRESEVQGESVKQKSIVIPVNLRYSIGLGSLASVYAAAGPQWGYNIGGKSFTALLPEEMGGKYNYTASDSQFSINLGAGVTLFSHLEAGFTYNIACGKTGEADFISVLGDAAGQVTGIEKSRTNAWQIHLAYWF